MTWSSVFTSWLLASSSSGFTKEFLLALVRALQGIPPSRISLFGIPSNFTLRLCSKYFVIFNSLTYSGFTGFQMLSFCLCFDLSTESNFRDLSFGDVFPACRGFFFRVDGDLTFLRSWFGEVGGENWLRLILIGVSSSYAMPSWVRMKSEPCILSTLDVIIKSLFERRLSWLSDTSVCEWLILSSIG